jgi:aminopeptidase N
MKIYRMLPIAVSVCMLLTAIAAGQVYLGPTDQSGRVRLDPPTAAEMQKMIEERVEKHPCMHKSRFSGSKQHGASLTTAISVPTSNMYDYDVEYYKIDIGIDMSEFVNSSYLEISGSVEIQLESLMDGLSYIDLNINPSLAVSQVTVDGVMQTFNQMSEIITVNLDETIDMNQEITLVIQYSGFPLYEYIMYWGGIYCFEVDGDYLCSSSAEPYGARGWFPCKDYPFDKPDSVDLIITHPAVFEGQDWTCAAIGLLQSNVDNGDNTKTAHWKESSPVSTYLVAFSVGRFDVLTQEWEYAPGESMPVEHYFSPSYPPDLTWTSTYHMENSTIPALDALSSVWGIYPFYQQKYGHMHWWWGGAMEHQTCTSILPDFGSEWVIAHELAHHWAGDQVTCRDFHHIWLNEGFASYAEVLYMEYYYGWPTAKAWLMSQRHLHAGTPYVENLETQNVFDGNTVYDKGSWLVHMLRNQMGDSLFFEAMDYYFHESEFAGAGATTEDLNAVCSEFYGSDMSWFFGPWVYQEGQPNYIYSFMSEPDEGSRDGYTAYLYLQQDNMDGIFPMNIEIQVFAGEFDSTYRVWNGSGGELYEFHVPEPADSVKIDPEDKILRYVQEQPFTMYMVDGTLPEAYLGVPYEHTFGVIGGTPPYTFEKTLGQFPYGLTFDPDTGTLSGTPGWIAKYYFELRCTDASSPPLEHVKSFSLNVTEAPPLAGDCDGSGGVELDDVVCILNYVFNAGEPPDPMDVIDCECSGTVDIDDVVYLITYIFAGGPPPHDMDNNGIDDC